MKRKYDKPTIQVVLLQHRTTILSGSEKSWDVIGQGEDNAHAGARQYNDGIDWDE